MSTRDWLRERQGAVPVALQRALIEGAGEASANLCDDLMNAAARELSTVLAASPMSRFAALSLLTADAFATYAFEAAADDPATLPARAEAAMKLLAEQVQV